MNKAMHVGIRATIFTAIGVISSWFVIAGGLAFVFDRSNPDLALLFVPQHSAALAQKADLFILTAQTEKNERKRRALNENARKYASMAIQRDPTSAQAFRIIGMLEKGQERKSTALAYLKHAEKLSRREPGAQVYLAEYSFIDNDLVNGFNHLDIALRTSRTGQTLLFPALHAAMTDPSMTNVVVDALSDHPLWRANYIAYSLNQPTGSEDLARVLSRLSDFPGKTEETFVPFLVQQLIAEKKYLAAQNFYQSRKSARGKRDQFVRDSRFKVSDPLPPITWEFTNGIDARADLLSESKGGIEVSIDPGRTVTVARQFLFLPPGSYEMSSTIANVGDGLTLRWRILCTDAITVPIGTLLLQNSGAGKENFKVPSNACPYQWAELVASSVISADGANAEVMSFDIAQSSGN